MPGYDMNSKNLIEGFINEHVTGQGLDVRTEKAYRQDLEHFCAWMEQRQTKDQTEFFPDRKDADKTSDHDMKTDVEGLEDWMEVYLDYLTEKKKLSSSTVYRKNRVFGYYLSYLARHGIIARYRSLRPARGLERKSENRELLSRKECDAFFGAMNREYEELDSEFRKRICLRDMVMMELLFYHKIEISEILRMEIKDYDRRTGIVTVRRKRGKDSQIYLFSQELRRKMDEWLRERGEFRCEREYGSRMFVSKFGKPLSMKMVIKIFDKYKEMAGIEKEVTPKDLKENCMKQYARELVMERLGQESEK